MVKSNIQTFLPYDLEKVWNMVVSLKNYQWRSDLDSIKIMEEGKRFVECSLDGYMTDFIITIFEPMSRYEFDMNNENMHGHWTGVFSSQADGCLIDFTEEVTAKKLIMKPFVKSYLKKQQKIYLEDLKNALKL